MVRRPITRESLTQGTGWQPGADDVPPLSSEGTALRATLSLLWSRKWIIVSVAVVLLCATALWTFHQPRVYRANTALIVDQIMPRVLDKTVTEVVDVSPNAYRDTANYMKTQVTVACSTQVARLAAERLNLVRLDAFWPATPHLSAPQRTVEMAATWLTTMVSCSSRKDASIIDISAEHTDPKLAARLSSAMAQAYMDHNLDRKLSSAQGAVKWLSERLGDLKHELDDAEGKLYRYRKDNDLISLTLTDRQNLLSQQLSLLTQQWNQARAERIRLAAEAQQLNTISLDDPLAVPELPALQTEVMRQLKLRALAERSAYLQVSSRYLQKHPVVAAQNAKMEQAMGDLRKQLRAVIAGTTKQLKQARANEDMLSAALESTKKEAFATNEREMAYRRLERNADSAKRVYGMVLGRMTESDLTTKLKSNNVRLLEPAQVPVSPVRPRTHLNLLLGLLVGLLLGVGLVFGLEMLDNTIVAQEDIEAEGMVFLGSLPVLEGTPARDRTADTIDAQVRELVVQYKPRSPGAEDCRAIRTNLLFASPDKPLKKLLITSPGPGEGKTLTASNLAVTMAQRGSRVLIVDADMRRPSLHNVFGVPLKRGLSTALTGDGNVASLVKSTGIADLSVMTAGTLPPNPAELCHSERLNSLLEQLVNSYDLVILDSPPVLPVTDPVVLSTRCDGTLVVARSGRTSKDALRLCAKRLLDVGSAIVGSVINEVDHESARYKYRYRSVRARYPAYGYDPLSDGLSNDQRS